MSDTSQPEKVERFAVITLRIPREQLRRVDDFNAECNKKESYSRVARNETLLRLIDAGLYEKTRKQGAK